MILPSGDYVKVRRIGSGRLHHAGRILMLVDRWRSKADADAGKPFVLREDFVFGLAEGHTDPGGHIADHLVRVFGEHDREGLTGDHTHEVESGPLFKNGALVAKPVCPLPWSTDPDKHGYLTHPSMAQFKVELD